MELEVRHIFIKSLTTSASHQKLTLALYEIFVKVSNFKIPFLGANKLYIFRQILQIFAKQF